MKLIASLDRACETRMRSAARPRLALLAIIGFAIVAPLLSGSAIAAATGADKPATMMATAGMLGGLALTGPLREEDPGAPHAGGSGPAADEHKLTIGQRLSAAIASKADLQASIAERDTKIAALESPIKSLTEPGNATAKEIERLNAAIQEKDTALAEANQKISALEADAAEIDKALKSAETEAAALKAKESTVEKKAQEKVASLGFSAAALPAAEEAQTASIDELREQVQSTTDPAEKQRLVARIREMRNAA